MVAITAYCRICERTVYIGEDDTSVCPVCSTPLIETTDNEEPDGKKS
jgi:RNA polymerase subunit RPABC4/transcription elongation factor Spt4